MQRIVQPIDKHYDRTIFHFNLQADLDKAARTFGPLPSTYYLHVEWDKKDPSKLIFEPRLKTAKDAGDGAGKPGASKPPATLDAAGAERLEARRVELAAMTFPDLETLAGELGLRVKPKINQAAMVAAILDAEAKAAVVKT